MSGINDFVIENGVLTISEEGVYVLKGDFNGQIIVDAPDTDKVQLVLDNVKRAHKNSSYKARKCTR